MDTVDVDELDVQTYTSPEPEEYVASTQGPQFTDLFSVPTPEPNFTTEQPALSVDEPDDLKQQNGHSITTTETTKTVITISENNLVEESSTTVEQVKEITVNQVKQEVEETEVFTTLQNGGVDQTNTKHEEEFEFEVTTPSKETNNTSQSSPGKPQTLPVSSDTEPVLSTNTNETGHSRRMESIDFEMCSPAEVPQNKSIDLTIERQVSSSETTEKTEEVQVTDGAPNFSSLLTEVKEKPEELEDEFDFDDTPVVVKDKKSDMAAPQENRIQENKQQSTEETETPVVLDAQVTSHSAIANKPSEQTSGPAEVVTIEMTHSNEVPPPAPVSDDLMQAQDEWAAVQTITPEVQGEGTAVSRKAVEASPIISYTEAYQHSLDSDLQKYKSQIKTSVHRSGFKALKHALFGPPKLHRDLLDHRDNVFCLAQYSFSNEDSTHVRILQTIYKKLTGSKFDCPRFGSHWEQIGFQGNDPSTDLRGCGMLGLLQLLYMLTTPKYLSMARDIYKLSLHETQNFPFCVMGINISRIALQALREDCLNKECNKSRGDELITMFNDIYTATYYHMYTIWKIQHKTIAQTGFVIKELESATKKNCSLLLHELDRHVKQQKHKSNEDDTADGPVSFTKFSEE